MQGAWKVGLLVIIFIGLLFGAYAILGKSLFAPKTHVYYAEFEDAGGTASGTPVLLAGVKVGTVSNVALVGPKLARLTMEVDENTQIPSGSSVQLQTALIGIGQQPLMIVPPATSASNLAPGSVLKGLHISAMDSFLPDAKQTVAELNKTLVATRELLADQQLKSGVTKLLETSNRTVAEFGLIAQRTNALLGQNQATIQRAVANAARAMSDIQKSTAIVAQFAGDKRWRSDLGGMLDNLNKTSAKAQDLVANLNAFVTDPKLRGPLDATMSNTAKITDTGTRIAENTETISKNGIEISKNGVIVSEKAVQFADKAKALADEAKNVLEKLESVFGKKPSTSVLNGISGSLDVMRETHPNHARTDVNFAIPLKDQTLHVGLFDAFESNKVNAELGRQIQGTELLYGIYASKPAVGVDFRLAPGVFLRGDLFDINHPRGDVRARIEFGNGFYGWLGLNEVFKNNSPLIGLGFRK